MSALLVLPRTRYVQFWFGQPRGAFNCCTRRCIYSRVFTNPAEHTMSLPPGKFATPEKQRKIHTLLATVHVAQLGQLITKADYSSAEQVNVV